MSHFASASRTRIRALLASAVLACGAGTTLMAAPAWSLTTYNLNYISSNSNNSLSGTLTIDETDPAANSDVGGEPFPSWVSALNLTLNQAGTVTNYTLADYQSFRWIPLATPVDFAADLVPQFEDINFLASSPSSSPTGSATLSLSFANTDYILTSAIPSSTAVPGPVPFFGVAGALAWSRKLRRRARCVGGGEG